MRRALFDGKATLLGCSGKPRRGVICVFFIALIAAGQIVGEHDADGLSDLTGERAAQGSRRCVTAGERYCALRNKRLRVVFRLKRRRQEVSSKNDTAIASCAVEYCYCHCLHNTVSSLRSNVLWSESKCYGHLCCPALVEVV